VPSSRRTPGMVEKVCLTLPAGTYEIPISWGPAPSRFQMAFYPSCPVRLQIAAEPYVR
jgi:hypothetical protein